MKKIILIISLLIIFILILLNIYECPFVLLFGIPCPMCGMTRAIYNALQFKFDIAFSYHLFWPIVILFLIIHILIEFKLIKINKKIINIFLYIFCILNFIYYLYRLINGIGVVTFSFNESLVYKLYLLLKGVII